VKLVADSFTWPFRGDLRPKWALGLLCVALLPLLFIPLLGYAIQATRAAEIDPSQGPPPWRPSVSLVLAGVWVSLAISLSAIPFLFFLNPLSNLMFDADIGNFHDPAVTDFAAHVLAFLLLALPWGLLLLLVMPHATARFAATYEIHDFIDVSASIRGVARDFATWNVVAAAIVTAWIVGLACAGLFCIGIVPGIFYAILVSAHATSALTRKGPHSSAG
jgi:hypothetical protein